MRSAAMAEPVSLNKARKARARADAKRKAAENRVRFGRSKAERAADAAETSRLAGQGERFDGDAPPGGA